MNSEGKVTAAEFPVWIIFLATDPMIADQKQGTVARGDLDFLSLSLKGEVVLRARCQNHFGLQKRIDNQGIAPLLKLFELLFRKNRVIDLTPPVFLLLFHNAGDLRHGDSAHDQNIDFLRTGRPSQEEGN